ncbi:protein of unknown function [Pricia antarctica]|uniref:DUF4440 domain-containing protein n=1 Tax=Pricia antarctica TaxID=641691 RepID=A0A1G7G7P4_9FLAO|nr:nuclear transport factor 2 family protein [Pricia antarctica]SDE84168.1 protein of unknown function [Pricia antarctica]
MTKFIPFVFTLACLSFLACKDENRNTVPLTAESEKEAPALTKSEVENSVVALNAALVDAKKNSLQVLTSESLTYGHSSGKVQDREEFIDDVINGPFDFLSIDTSDESIHISGETAIARHVFSAKGMNNGKSADVHIGVILVFQKQNDKLHLLARQAYKL